MLSVVDVLSGTGGVNGDVTCEEGKMLIFDVRSEGVVPETASELLLLKELKCDVGLGKIILKFCVVEPFIAAVLLLFWNAAVVVLNSDIKLLFAVELIGIV